MDSIMHYLEKFSDPEVQSCNNTGQSSADGISSYETPEERNLRFEEDKAKIEFISSVDTMIQNLSRPEEFISSFSYQQFEKEIGIDTEFFNVIKIGLSSIFEKSDSRISSYKLLFTTCGVGVDIFIKVVKKCCADNISGLELHEKKIKSLLQLIKNKRVECSKFISEEKIKKFTLSASKVLEVITENKQKLESSKDEITSFIKNVNDEINSFQKLLKEPVVDHMITEKSYHNDKKGLARSKFNLLKLSIHDFVYAILERQIEIEMNKSENKGKKLIEFFTFEKVESIRANIEATLRDELQAQLQLCTTELGCQNGKVNLSSLID